jgi:hypothetical protein
MLGTLRTDPAQYRLIWAFHSPGGLFAPPGVPAGTPEVEKIASRRSVRVGTNTDRWPSLRRFQITLIALFFLLGYSCIPARR